MESVEYPQETPAAVVYHASWMMNKLSLAQLGILLIKLKRKVSKDQLWLLLGMSWHLKITRVSSLWWDRYNCFFTESWNCGKSKENNNRDIIIYSKDAFKLAFEKYGSIIAIMAAALLFEISPLLYAINGKTVSCCRRFGVDICDTDTWRPSWRERSCQKLADAG